MLWKRDDSDARRLAVVDELIAIPRDERQARIDLAVASGDLRAADRESALRLASRLESISVMTIPAIRTRPAVELESVSIPAQIEAGPAVPVAVHVAAADSRVDLSPVLAMLGELPLDALESAERLSSRRSRRRSAKARLGLH